MDGLQEPGHAVDIRHQKAAVKRGRTSVAVSVAALVALCLLSLSVGRYSIPVGQVLDALAQSAGVAGHAVADKVATVVLNVRLPRIVAAVLVGAALSVAGASYQSLFKNPLVSPDLLGVSSGACVGAALAIICHWPSQTVGLSAMVFGIAAVALTVAIPKLFRNDSNLMLILSGVLVGGLMSSIIGFLKYIADPDDELADIVYWTMGSLASTRWDSFGNLVPLIVVPAVVLVLLGWRMNLLTLGDKEAKSLGTNVRLMKVVIIVCSTLLTATATCLSGTIGWVGLIIPHFVRLLVGADNRFLIPLSITCGAMFMLVIDTLARTVAASEIPLSIFTGVIAVPLFIILLAVKKPRIS